MSSALAMILAAGMTVPGDVPKEVSEEVEEQRLDLSGEWAGDWWFATDVQFKVSSIRGRLFGLRTVGDHTVGGTWIYIRDLIDEGYGNLRGRWDLPDKKIHGIYRQDGTRLMICFTEISHPRPTSFRTGDGHYLLILHRVKPRK